MIKRPEYLKWIRTQPCCHCGNPETEPHHIIGIGMGAIADKADDIHSMPLCRRCHEMVHQDPGALVDSQMRWLLRTQHKAQEEGML